VISVTRAEFSKQIGSSNEGNGSAVQEGARKTTAHTGTPSAYFIQQGQPPYSQIQPHGTVPLEASRSAAMSHSTATAARSQKEVAALCAMLPAETEAGAHPVLLIMNAFDCSRAQSEEDAEFFDELEVRCSCPAPRQLELTIDVLTFMCRRTCSWSAVSSARCASFTF
jgi:hypothetical protein